MWTLGDIQGRLGLSIVGLVVEIVALLCIPLVVLRRKEPSSTAAWILALVFLPVVGATLFLLFGRERVRLPVQWKREADRDLALRRKRLSSAPIASPPPERLGVSSVWDLARDGASARGLFRVSGALAGVTPVGGNRVDLLIDGDATYEAIGAAIDGARRSVHVEYYLVRRGRTAEWLRDRLCAAARRGVEVRLLMDGYGSFWLGRAWLRPLREAGAKVAFFLPARLLFFQPMNLRNHRKIVVVDGDTAFTGGINVGDEYRGRHGPWRDTHLAIRGPAARQLAEVFVHDWHFATREHIDAHPPDERASKPQAPDAAEAPAEALEPPRIPRAPGLDLHESAGMSRHPTAATVAIVPSGPDLEGPAREAIHRLFFSAITLARSRVWITTPYFIPDRSIVVALQCAAARGVDVRLLFPSRSNLRFVFQAGRWFYEELLEAGVSIHEYGPGMIHAKTMVIDGQVALVGSANMDLRSFRLNFEVHAIVRDGATAAELEACFEADLAASPRIELEAFRQRPAALRVVEGAARLLSPLM